jgi:hypothetical protein
MFDTLDTPTKEKLAEEAIRCEKFIGLEGGGMDQVLYALNTGH